MLNNVTNHSWPQFKIQNINQFNPPHSKLGPGFPMLYANGLFVFSKLKWEVIAHFVDIGGIDDHHCLNFLFIMKEIKTK
jgi:hypothetical protein